MSSTGFQAKLEGWHCSCVYGRAPEPLSLYPECLHLPHGNSPFGFLSKPSVCMGVLWSPEHSAIPSILQSSLLFLPKTTLPPIAPKALCTSLHINRCSKFDRWTIKFNHQSTSRSHSCLNYNTLQCEFSNSRCSVLFYPMWQTMCFNFKT